MNKRLTVRPRSNAEVAEELERLAKDALARIDPEITGEFRLDLMHQVGLAKGCLMAQDKLAREDIEEEE